MTQLEKAIARLQSEAAEARIEDVRRVLVGYGYREARQRGVHLTFSYPERRRVTLPLTHGKTVKRVYVTELLVELSLDG